ncbi:RepB family protein [Clostridium sporogenes]|nr:replication initiation protein [Clostridium sporogenes]SUY94558.1 RepB family protein [Clostridium sporogenes]
MRIEAKVIKVSINEINTNTDLLIDYEELKKAVNNFYKVLYKSKVQDKARNEIALSLEDKESDT